MVWNGCPLNEAYNNVGRKKRREEKNESNDYFNKVIGYSPDSDYSELTKSNEQEQKQVQEQVQVQEQKQVQEQNQEQVQEQVQEDTRFNNAQRQISINEDDYINYQIYLRNTNRLPNVEGFGTIRDGFNEVLLFALLGIFFLTFTDYIYKLGKKSY